MTTYTYEMIPASDLTASDLIDDINSRAKVYADYEASTGRAYGVTPRIECARVTIDGRSEPAQAVFFYPEFRGAVAWGADAQWSDCKSLDDLIRRYVGNDMAE